MAEVLDDIKYEVGNDDPKPKPAQPVLTPEHRTKLGSIVQEMIKNKESDQVIQAVVDHYKSKYGAVPAQPKQEQPAFQIQLSQPTLRAIPATTVTQPSAPNKGINIPKEQIAYVPDEKTYEIQKQAGKARVAHEKVNTALVGNDAQYEKKLRESRRDNYTLESLRNEYKQKGQILAPQDEQRLLQKEKDRQFNLPVTPEDITDFKTGTILNPNLSRKFVKDLNDKDVSESAYQVDKFNEIANDPDPYAHKRIEKINQIAKGIKNGKYIYDPESKTVVQPLGLVGSLIEGTINKFKADEEHDFLKNTSNDAAIIMQLEDERNNPNIDEPIKVPRSKVGEAIKSLAEMPLKPVIAGVAGTIGGTFIGNPELGTVAATALGAYENRKAQYRQTFKQVYNELRDQGKPEFTALSEARKQAENAQEIGTIVGGAQGLIGAKIGAIPIKGTSFNVGFQQAVGDFLKKNGSEFGKIALDAVAQGGLAASGEVAKNKLAQAAGIKRDLDSGTADAFWGNVLMAGGIGAALKLGRGMSNINYKKVLNGLIKNVPEETINATLQEKVTNGEITRQAADQALNEINEYRVLDKLIPPNVTDEARFKIQEKIKKIDQLKAEIETTHESYHPEKKEQIEQLKKDILALSKETEKAPKPESGLAKDKEKEAIDFAHELVDEGVLPDTYWDDVKKDPIKFWQTIAQQAQNRDENWKPLANPLYEQSVRDNYGDTVVDYAKELFPAPEMPKPELPKPTSEHNNSLNDLNERAKKLGYKGIKQLNTQEQLNENASPEVKKLLQDYGEHNGRVKSLTNENDISNLDEDNFGTWVKANDVQRDSLGRVSNGNDLPLASKRIRILNERGMIEEANAETERLKSSRKKDNWAKDEWNKRYDDELSQEEVNNINKENSEFNRQLDKELNNLEPKKSKISVIQPGEIKQPETITIAPKEIGAGKVPAEQIGHVEISEHGEDTKTAAGKENGIGPAPLTKEGQKEAKELGQYIASNDKTKIITSEVERGLQTAEEAAKEAKKITGKDIPIERNELLNTANIGSDEGKPEGTFKEKEWFEGKYMPEGAESPESFKERMEKAYQYVKSLPEDTHIVSHSKVMRAFDALSKTDGKWTDETTNIFLNNKEITHAIQEPSTGGVFQYPQEGVGTEGGQRGGMEPGKQGEETTGTRPQEEDKTKGQEGIAASTGGNLIGISHDALNDLAQKLGLPKIERGQVRTPEEYAQMGRELLKQGVDPNTVLNSNLEPHEKASVARAYLEEQVKNADAIEDKSSPEYKKALQDIADFKANVIKKLGTQFAELGRALQGKRDLETDSFTAVSSKITDDTGKPLSPDQAQKVKELTETNKALQSKVDDLEAKLTQATDEDLGKGTKTPTKEPKTKKTHEEYVKERKDAFSAARDALKKLKKGGGGLGVSIFPGAQQLAVITPHIGKIVKSFLAEGVNKLGDIVDAIHDELSKDIIGLRRRDVVDLIAGKYETPGIVKASELSEIRKQSRLVAKLEDLQNGLPEDFDKNKTEQSPEVKKLLEQIKKVKKDLADMGYMASKKEEPLSVEEKNIKRLEKELEDLKQGIAKQKSPSRELTDREIELKEQIKDEREKLGLVSSKEEKPLTDEEIKEQQEEKLKAIQEQFVNKKGNKFTHDEAKVIYGYMRENYLDKGVKFRDAIEQVSNDTGLSFEQVSNAVTTPKTKRISDAMWKKHYDLQKNRMATQRYVDSQSQNPFVKAYKKVTGARRSESIFGHAGVFVGTHAGMTLFDLPRAKYTVKAFLNAYKFGYGKVADYVKAMEGLKKRTNYELAQRSGLKNNPDVIDNDAEITKPFLSKYLGTFMESGKKGYNAMKILRQDLFDAHYNALSAAEKADPGSAISIAQEINNATGASNLDLTIRNKQGDVIFDPNEVFFAPGMESARWGKLVRNPAKATSVALQALFKPSSVSVKDKVFAKVWAKRAGTQLATYLGLLTVNSGIQALATDDKEKQVNLFDPTKSDWLKMKFGNTTLDPTSGMLSTLHFIQQMAYQSAFDESKKYHTTEEKSIGRTALRYGIGKLAPFYGDVAEGILRHDYNGNTMPWSDAKPLHGYNHKLTWEEYAESKLPLPVAEGFKTFYESAHANGMSKKQIDNVLNGLQYGSISGLTGFRAYETKNSEGGSTTTTSESTTPSREKLTRIKPTKVNPHKR